MVLHFKSLEHIWYLRRGYFRHSIQKEESELKVQVFLCQMGPSSRAPFAENMPVPLSIPVCFAGFGLMRGGCRLLELRHEERKLREKRKDALLEEALLVQSVMQSHHLSEHSAADIARWWCLILPGLGRSQLCCSILTNRFRQRPFYKLGLGTKCVPCPSGGTIYPVV